MFSNLFWEEGRGGEPSADGKTPAIFIGRGGMGFEEGQNPFGAPEKPIPPSVAEGLELLQKSYYLHILPLPGKEDGGAIPQGIDRKNSFFLGAYPEEVGAARKAGFFGLYLLSGGGGTRVGSLPGDIPVFHNFFQAVDWILRDADPLGTLEREILEGAELLKGGGVVAFPTETVYGLGADALNPQAVEEIFRLKGRPRFNPLIVHLGAPEQVDLLASSVPPPARALMEEFWPGPLTLVLPKKPEVPDLTTGGNPTVAVRMPEHPVALALLREAGLMAAAPSANLFGRTSPTTAAHVLEQLGGRGYKIIDGGACRVGLESTVLSLAGPVPRLLRPGGISREALEALAGPIEVLGKTGDPAQGNAHPQSPGLLASHYAPRTPLRIVAEMPRENEDPRVGLILLGEGHYRSFGPVEVLSPDGDLAEAAANLYAALRRLDQRNLWEILAPRFPDFGIGPALNDRLERAARGSR